MSDLIPSTDLELDFAPPRPRAKGTLEFIGRNAFALSDQAVISASNFATMLFAGRAMELDGFGQFALAMSAVMFLGTIQSALITQPHGVIGSGKLDNDLYRQFTGTLAAIQVGFACAMAVVALLIGAIAGAWMSTDNLGGLILALAPLILAWQLQEFARRVLYTEQRFGAALVNDTLAYGGAAAALAAMWWFHEMTPTSAILALAGVYGLAAVVGALQIRRSFRWTVHRTDMRECWDFGKWLVGAEILNWFSSFAMFQYAVAIMIGPAASASLKAAQVIFGPARIIATFLSNVLPLHFSRTLASSGKNVMHGQLMRVMWVVFPVSAAYCLGIAIFSSPLLRLFFGQHKYESDALVLSLYAGTALLGNMLTVLTAAMTARQLTRQVFFAYILAGLVAMPLAVFGILLWKVPGAVCGMIVTELVLGYLFWRVYRRSSGETESSDPEPRVGEVVTDLP